MRKRNKTHRLPAEERRRNGIFRKISPFSRTFFRLHGCYFYAEHSNPALKRWNFILGVRYSPSPSPPLPSPFPLPAFPSSLASVRGFASIFIHHNHLFLWSPVNNLIRLRLDLVCVKRKMRQMVMQEKFSSLTPEADNKKSVFPPLA